VVKFRNAGSYYGNTPEMIKRQRSNLIPGSKYQKKEIQEARLNCWWEGGDLESKQFMFEGYENKEELKSESYLDNWWAELELEDKKHIYKVMMAELTSKEKIPILEHMQECLKEKLEKGI